MKKKEKAKEKVPPDQAKVTRLVREIISGRPINQVPDKLLPRVHIELSCAKSRAMKDGLINRIQMIQKVMLEVEQYEKERAKLKSAKTRSKSSFLNREENPKFNNDDSDDIDAIFEIYHPPPVAVLDSILDDLADGIPFEIAETPNIPYLIDRSKERIDQYLQSGEYFTAQRYENVHIQLVSLIEDRKREKKIESKLNYLTNLLNENQTKLKEIKDDKKKKLDDHEKKVKDSINRSREEYDKSNREYDEITNGPLPISARKFSSEYLNIREKERFLIQSRRYEEAASIKAEADRMEAKELSLLMDEFVEKREKKKKLIEERQNKALKCIIENAERTRLRITNEYDQKIQEIQRTVENIQNRIKLVDSNYIDETQQIQQNQQTQQNSLSYLKLIPTQENNTNTPSNIKKNTSKFTLPLVPRETTTSKLRASPFVTQATPQITSPDKSSLNRNKNQIQNQNKFVKKDRNDNQKIKVVNKNKQQNKSDTKISVSFSSNSFISSDDDEQKKNNQSNISINEINISSDNNNNNASTINENSLIKDEIIIDENSNSLINTNENSLINDDSLINNNENSLIKDEIIIDENSNSLINNNENSINNDDIIIDENSNSQINDDSLINNNENSLIKDDSLINENSNSLINNNENSLINDDIIIDENSNSLINTNENSLINNGSLINTNENGLINNGSKMSPDKLNESFSTDDDDDENKNSSFVEKNCNDFVVDDFIVDDDNKNDIKRSDFDNIEAEIAVVDSGRNKTADVGKNLIRKKNKKDVTQPNYQLIRNKNALNHEFHRPVSVQKKLPAPAKRSRSQVRDQPPSPHLYSPNFKAKKKNDKSENPIRAAKTNSKK